MGKVNRNDPCPCGSGKKFKKCCEGKSWKDNVKVLPSSLPKFFQNTFAKIETPEKNLPKE